MDDYFNQVLLFYKNKDYLSDIIDINKTISDQEKAFLITYEALKEYLTYFPDYMNVVHN